MILPSNSKLGGSQILSDANHNNMDNPHSQYVNSRFGYKNLKYTETIGSYSPILEIKINTNDTFTLQRFIIFGLDNNAGRPVETCEIIIKMGVQGTLSEGIKNINARLVESRNFNQDLIKMIVTQKDNLGYVLKIYLKHDVKWRDYKVQVLNDYFSNAIVNYFDNEDVIETLPEGVEITLDKPTFLKRYGDTIEGNLNFKEAYQGINHEGQQILTNNGNKTIVSGKNGNVGGLIFRPKGQNETDVQIEVDVNGAIIPTGPYPHIGLPAKKFKQGHFETGISIGCFESSKRPANMINGFTVFDTTLKKLITYYDGKWYSEGIEVATE